MTAQSMIPAEILDNRYWRHSDAVRVLELWRASGIPLARFAREQGVRPGRLQRWKRRLSFAPQSTTETATMGSAQFAPVRLVPSVKPLPEPSPQWLAEIELVNGRKVRVGSNVDLLAIRALLEAVEC